MFQQCSQIVVAEFNAGWIAYWLDRIDRGWKREYGSNPDMPKPQSVHEIWRRQFYATIENDQAALRTRNLIGENTLMWGFGLSPHGLHMALLRRRAGRSVRGLLARGQEQDYPPQCEGVVPAVVLVIRAEHGGFQAFPALTHSDSNCVVH